MLNTPAGTKYYVTGSFFVKPDFGESLVIIPAIGYSDQVKPLFLSLGPYLSVSAFMLCTIVHHLVLLLAAGFRCSKLLLFWALKLHSWSISS